MRDLYGVVEARDQRRCYQLDPQRAYLEIGEQGAPGQINRTTILARPADMPLPDLMILAEAIERG